MMKHFLHITDLSIDEIQSIVKMTYEHKHNRLGFSNELRGQSWGLLFYKNSTRTRVSFEVGINELGGNPMVLNSQNTQISRGETIQDTAKVLSRYLHGLVIRTFDHSIVTDFAKNSSIPIVNGLTDFNHPCQILSDIYSLLEIYSPKELDINSLKNKQVTFLGDTSSNMANSWILASSYLGFNLNLSGPKKFEPNSDILNKLKDSNLDKNFYFTDNVNEATANSDVLYTDVWISMGDLENKNEKISMMKNYQVNETVLSNAKKDALFLHCLPAHYDEEVTQEVLEGKQSIVYNQAENRLHTQKAILSHLNASN